MAIRRAQALAGPYKGKQPLTEQLLQMRRTADTADKVWTKLDLKGTEIICIR